MAYGTTYEDFLAATNSILGRGEKVTVRSVRTEIGQGSMATIQPYLKKWRDEQVVKSQGVPLPETINASILGEMHRRENDVKLKFLEQIEDAELVIKELTELTKNQAGMIEKLKEELSKKEKFLSAKEAMLEKSEQEVRELKTSLDQEQKNVEKARIQAAQAVLKSEGYQESTKNLSEENKTLRLKIEDAQKRASEFDKRAAVAEAKLETYEKQKTSKNRM